MLCLTLLLSGLTSAAPPSSETAARAAALEAKKAFDLGDFPKAIEQYEVAYKLKTAPGILFNLGQSHRRAGNLDKATFYFKRYLETNPPEVQAKATEEVLAQVEAQLAAQREGALTDQSEQAKKDEERRQAEEQQRLLELEKTRLAVVHAQERQLTLEAALKLDAPPPPPPPPPPVYQRWWFWTAIGAVVVGGVVTGTAVATQPQPVQPTFPDINAR